MYYPDWLAWERSVIVGPFSEGDVVSLRAAKKLRIICTELGLAITALQPILDFEGCLEQEDRDAAFAKAKAFVKITSALGAPVACIASRWGSIVPISHDLDILAADLGDLADFAATVLPPVKVAYEAVAWGEVVNTWSQAWEVVRLVDRPNLGLLIDTYNWLAREYADPFTLSGLQSEAEERFSERLQDFGSSVDGSKIFFLQIADARKMSPPLKPSGEDMPLIQQWSRKHVSHTYLLGVYAADDQSY